MNSRHKLIICLLWATTPCLMPFADDAGNYDRSPPITVAVSTIGDFASGYSWYISVNSSGSAELFIDSWPIPVRKQFIIKPEQLKILSDAIDHEDFFNLKDEYGQQDPESSTKTLTIVRGSDAKTVTILSLRKLVHDDHKLLIEPARALRVYNVIRNWFNESDAVDLRRYDQIILDVVDKEKEAQHVPPANPSDR